MPLQPNHQPPTQEEVDRLPESFGVEFMNKGHEDLAKLNAVYQQGKFIEGDPESGTQDRVVVQGRYSDGTTVELTYTKGVDYVSPQEYALRDLEEWNKQQEHVQSHVSQLLGE